MVEKIKCVRRIQFCAGHRVYRHTSKCANLHGHNYVAYFHAEAYKLDALGRIIDFSVLKEKIGGWIDMYWDHGFIYYSKDKEVSELFNSDLSFSKNKCFKLEQNPTAENMALFLLKEICPFVLKETGVKVTKIVLHETENCSAIVENKL